jgi:hypothetical protein
LDLSEWSALALWAAAAISFDRSHCFALCSRDRLVDRLWPHSIRITHCDFSIVELKFERKRSDRQEFEK